MIYRALIVLGLLACLAAVANADGGRALPAGTTITVKLPTGPEIIQTLTEDHLLITADTARSCAVAKAMRDWCKGELLAVVRAAEVAKPEPPSRFWMAVRYTAIGVAIGGAFALGIVVAR